MPSNELGQIDTGIGKGGSAGGTAGLIAPTVSITKPYETRRIDGVEIEFQLTPGTEAPAEMNLYLPQFRVLCMAENATRTMHNILTPRGALVRDPKAWGKFLDESLVRYGDKVEIMVAQHNWPTWGGEHIRTLLADQRDMYTYLTTARCTCSTRARRRWKSRRPCARCRASWKRSGTRAATTDR
ncbi:hypothetical protein AWV79_00245 [Cupriavidus sp. UYMMa02A]|nr:hypothetical protein AWV79_00245 [Cupriavidus sp. UYMMa02A]